MNRWIARLFQRSSKSGFRSGASSYYTANKDMQEEAITKGKRDGGAGMPGTMDASLTQHEQSIIALSKQVVQNTAGDMQRVDEELLADFLEARRDFESAQHAYERKRRSPKIDGRPLQLEISRWIYLPLVIILMAGEIAVNYVAFEKVFQENPYITYLAAATLGFALLIAAHLVGAAVRQGKDKRWTIITCLLIVGITFTLAYLRLKFVEITNAERAVAQSVFGIAGVQLDQVAVSAFFFIFNLLFLAASAWMAALRHDPDAHYEELHRQYIKSRRRALLCKKARETNRSQFLSDANDWIGVCRRLLTQYREANLNARDTKAQPRSWLDHPLEKAIQVDETLFAFKVSTDIGLLHGEPAEAGVPDSAEMPMTGSSLGAHP